MSQPSASADILCDRRSNSSRLLDQLQQGKQSLTQLAQPFTMSLPAISQHLQVLCEVQLVTQSRSGRQRIYRLNPQPLQQVYNRLSQYEQFWTGKLGALGDYLEEHS